METRQSSMSRHSSFGSFALLCIVCLLRVNPSTGFSCTSSLTTKPLHVAFGKQIPTTVTTLRVGLSSSQGPDDLTSTEPDQNVRSRLRKITGFSLTAFRRTMRTITGISLTALYASVLATSGAWIRQTMKYILAPFPTWLRYFVQPFLILYYAPLFVLRNLSRPNRDKARRTHELFVEGWKEAVETADQSSSYWPVHIDSNGNLEKDFDEVDINEAVAESVEVTMDQNKQHAGENI